MLYSGDHDVCDEMSDAYKRDIDELVAYSLRRLADTSDATYSLHRLLNGYKQFDPTRGASYILDLILRAIVVNQTQPSFVHRRVELMRPLGLVEIVPMPYVTETVRIHVLVAFTTHTLEHEIDDFFKAYRRLVLDASSATTELHKLTIHVVFIADDGSTHAVEALLNATISELTTKYSSLTKTPSVIRQARIVHNKQQHQTIALADYASDHLQSIVVKTNNHNSPLVLIVPPCVELHTAFLNRVRLNTIRHTQVFFPIPFAQYMPEIVYEVEKRKAESANSSFQLPDLVQMHKAVGHFDDSYEFVSFYLDDYVQSAQVWQTTDKPGADLYDVFESNERLILLRANDEALRCRWHRIDMCHDEAGDEETNEMCRERKEASLGTKAQLANHLLQPSASL